jgi:hypothetical protein
VLGIDFDIRNQSQYHGAKTKSLKVSQSILKQRYFLLHIFTSSFPQEQGKEKQKEEFPFS